MPELRVVGEFDNPVQVAAPFDDERLFVVEQAGRIEILSPSGELLAEPFLDLTADTLSGGERGLLGLAFAADYATSGEFFVYLTAREPTGEIQIRRYEVSEADPNRAVPRSGVTILRQAHDRFANHNGGGLRVGPDGKLWASLGDGGGANDPLRSAQDPSSLLGKLLRLERDGGPAAGNPFIGASDGSRPEIWHLGLRNAFRFSFDRATNDLILGDVGQDAREEIDFAAAEDSLLPGANWGWPCFEGTRTNLQAGACSAPGALEPVLEKDHDSDGAVSITGGVVVRDPGVPGLLGRYLYTDLGFPELRSAVLGTADDRAETALALPAVVSIDEDGCGRVVVTSITGRVARLVDGTPAPCRPGSPPAPPPAVSCGLSAKAAARKRSVLVTLRARASCTVTLRLLRGSRRGPSRSVSLVAGAQRTVRLRAASIGRRVRVELALDSGGTPKVRRLRVSVAER